MNFKKIYLIFGLLLTQLSFSQEGIAVYSDYLSDNYYLIHPSMAGAANCAKIRLTARQQWFGQDDAPQLQTISFNGSVGPQSGIGVIAFNDKNGYHSQTGAKLTYAHHIRFSRSDYDLNQLSFGMSAGLISSRLDETKFDPEFDPIVDGGMKQKDSYFNVDIGASYHYLDFYAHFTAKNVVKTKRNLYTDYESDNLTAYLFSVGYVFGFRESLQWEPSILFKAIDETKEKTIDINLKVYKELDFGRLWGGLSYRRALESAQYIDGVGTSDQTLQYFTPIIGVNYKNFMFSYTYSYLTGAVKFDNSGFHQLTIGLNLFCKREKYDCNCPAVN
ncbi:type IX secretion system membrane protein PorP/SprF [Flavobacterium sp. NRK1]|jgi:type IX secretion system PorP/SprF family membrane protein|uniref:PorP/SprF family type IX secretion system membrane protein n=1 Tax=Flavobacterium sp. NRK1 TaxID=2954929 RepID=UPI0020924C14|nr:type IX secretion system membrane protein PorP/SprF [Flavobacterium sp. NRK1]MCO6147172.1 type IX secretion system membrane protein PorP/SprF [Flavobacterium sp. NRK1]